MKKAQTIRKKRLTIPRIAARRQNPLEKEIPFLYSAEKGENPNNIIFKYQKCTNPTHLALYGQIQELK